MIVITPHVIEELRVAADRAKCEGHWVDGEMLHTLLDSVEAAERAGGAETVDAAIAKAEKVDELEGKVEDLETEIEALNGDLETEADNIGDLLGDLDEAADGHMIKIDSSCRSLKSIRSDLADLQKRLRGAKR